jgi:glycosyltransferase involved in cell wall biosynthesis
MYDKINLMLPTYGRSETKLPVFIKSVLKTVSNLNNIRFLFCVHEKDTETADYLREFLGKENPKVSFKVVWEALETPHLAKYFNAMYDDVIREFGKNQIVSMLGDDMEFTTQGWDLILLESINNIDGYGVVFGDCGTWWSGDLCVNMFTTVKTVELLHPLPFMCEHYPRDQIDIVWRDTMKKLGMYHFVPGMKILHHHSTAAGAVKDETYKRLELEDKKVEEKIKLLDDYVDSCVHNVKTNLVKTAEYSVSVMMTTHNRIPLLKETVYSLANSLLLPETLYVFDDASEDGDAIWNAFLPIRNIVSFCIRNKNLGCAKSTPAALHDLFEKNDAEVVLILDSDIQVDVLWYLKVCQLYNKLKDTENFGSINLLNLPDNPKGKPSSFGGLLEKPHWGACGALITREFWEKYVVPNENVENGIWDNKSSHAASLDGKINYVTTPSMIQHTGTMQGTNLGAKSWAIDFRGKDSFDVSRALNESGGEKKVLFGIFGRYGDIIMVSMIRNMLIELGYKVTWLSSPYYSNLLCYMNTQSSRMYKDDHLDFKMAPWGDLPTEKMMEYGRFGFKYMCNVQPGSRENHDVLLGTGLHIAMFMKKRVEKILGIELPNNFIDYLDVVGENTSMYVQDRDRGKPLMIIAPEVISVKSAFGPNTVNELIEEHENEYDVRVLTIKRPEGLPFQQVRKRYISGLTFEQCIDLLKITDYFIGNDSGLAWAAMYNRNCYKKIYHRVERLVETNCWYKFIDPKAEDFIVE